MAYASSTYTDKQVDKNSDKNVEQTTDASARVLKKMVVSERDNIATLFEDGKAVEFVIHRGDMLLGDVYLAEVENILPSIDAAFVNVGGDKMGFLHASDVKGKGPLQDRLKPKQRMVVQVMKEPTGHKGPRVTTDISLPGRFLVLLPESKGISISRKIDRADERARLKAIVSMVKPPGVGVIIRTEAYAQKESDLVEDFEQLLERWQNIVAAADTGNPATMLYRDQDLLYRVIREMISDDVDELVVDTNFGFQRAQHLLQSWGLDRAIKVTLHNTNQSVMIAHGVEREIKQALQTKVPLPSGGYLYIQPTEALCVIDVNSGKFTSLNSQAETIRKTNLESCAEIARQLRLRNIGGMIIVDFIDMESRAHQLEVLEAFDKALAPDKSKPQMGQLTDLGLVEMTRHRQGQALSEVFAHNCAQCHGTGRQPEHFNWAPPDIDSDIRASRSKFPVRQARGSDRNRGGGGGKSAPPAQAQSAVVGGRSGNGGQNGKAESDRPDKKEHGREHGKDQSSKPDRVPKPAYIVPGSILLARKAELENKKNFRGTMDLRQLTSFYQEKLLTEYGLTFASVGKVAIMPYQANTAIGRINPKAMDIISLVRSIEMAELPAFGMMDDEESEDINGASEDTMAEGEESSDKPRQGRYSRQGQSRYEQDRHDEKASDDVLSPDEDDEVPAMAMHRYDDEPADESYASALEDALAVSDEVSDDDEAEEEAPPTPKRGRAAAARKPSVGASRARRAPAVIEDERDDDADEAFVDVVQDDEPQPVDDSIDELMGDAFDAEPQEVGDGPSELSFAPSAFDDGLDVLDDEDDDDEDDDEDETDDEDRVSSSAVATATSGNSPAKPAVRKGGLIAARRPKKHKTPKRR